jgi:predicted transposase/invertase (TIGR01784 family)
MGYTTTFEQFAREEGMKIGRKEGRQEGENKKALAIARSMLAENASLDFIKRVTQLSDSDLAELMK